ncbi:MAG: hypothetical protein P8J51_04170 [Dehalococcoidia bacterium]|jgi:hypothetical protein|nr:hypothetical protein [Dehalococcoidia bacterium]
MINRKKIFFLIFIILILVLWFLSSPAKTRLVIDSSIYESIASKIVISEENNQLAVLELMDDKPTVFILLRHFG